MNANTCLIVRENWFKARAIAAVARNLASYVFSAIFTKLLKHFAHTVAQLLGAVSQSHVDLYWNLAFSTIFPISLLLGVHLYAIGVAGAVLIVHTFLLPMFAIWTNRYVLYQS